MTQTTWPVTGEPMTNTQFAELIEELASPGVDGTLGSTTLRPYRTAGGLFVPAGGAITAKGAYYQNTADVQITVPANATGSVRNDLLVLRHDFAVSPSAVLTYITGGAAYPTPVEATDIPLAYCPVPSGSAVPSTATDARLFTGLDVVPCRVVSDVPAGLRRIGRHVYESTTGLVKVWDGTAWKAVQFAEARQTGAITPATGWANTNASGFADAYATKDSTGRVQLHGELTGSNATTGKVVGTVAAGFRPAAAEMFVVSTRTSTFPAYSVFVTAAGAITCQSNSTGAFTGLGLSNITYYAA